MESMKTIDWDGKRSLSVDGEYLYDMQEVAVFIQNMDDEQLASTKFWILEKKDKICADDIISEALEDYLGDSDMVEDSDKYYVSSFAISQLQEAFDNLPSVWEETNIRVTWQSVKKCVENRFVMAEN